MAHFKEHENTNFSDITTSTFSNYFNKGSHCVYSFIDTKHLSLSSDDKIFTNKSFCIKSVESEIANIFIRE